MWQALWWFHRDMEYKLEHGVESTHHVCKCQAGARRLAFPQAVWPAVSGTGGWNRPSVLASQCMATLSTCQCSSFCHSEPNKKSCIQVLFQLGKSPDVNTEDLAFFASPQADFFLTSKEIRSDFIDGVVYCWEAILWSAWHQLGATDTPRMKLFCLQMVEMIAENTEDQDDSAALGPTTASKETYKCLLSGLQRKS